MSPPVRGERESGWRGEPSNHSSLVAMASGATTSKKEGRKPPTVFPLGTGASPERRAVQAEAERAKQAQPAGARPHKGRLVGFWLEGWTRGEARPGDPSGEGWGPGWDPGTQVGGRGAPPLGVV